MNNRISMKYDVKEAQGQQKTETCGEPWLITLSGGIAHERIEIMKSR